MPVATRRAYEPASSKDGYRVLIDGLWPRGLTKEKLQVAQWLRELAPSVPLRKWYGHDPEKWETFRSRYRKELRNPARRKALEELATRAAREKVTLVFGARDSERSNAAVVREMIRELVQRSL